MEENDILQLIDAERTRRRQADGEHLRQLAGRPDVRRWSARRRSAVRAAAMAALLLVPGVYAMLLPRPADEQQVLCNISGDERLVVARACSTLGTCENPMVANMLRDGGGQFIVES